MTSSSTAARFIAPAAVLVLAAIALLALTVQDQFAGFNWDDAFYLLMADKYFGRLGDAPAMADALSSHRGYPPLYPLWLGLFGGGSRGIATAYVANAAALVLAGAAFYVFVRRSGVALASAVALLVCFFTMPALLRYGTALW